MTADPMLELVEQIERGLLICYLGRQGQDSRQIAKATGANRKTVTRVLRNAGIKQTRRWSR